MATQNDMNFGSGTVPHTAQATAPRYVMPHQMEVERIGDSSAPVVNVFPDVRGGVCEFCGVIDPNQPSDMQYKLCPHYRGKQLGCSYCPPGKNQNEIITHSTMKIYSHPTIPNRLVICCGSYDCARAHYKRWSNQEA